MLEIFFCNLIVLHQKKRVQISGVVYKNVDGNYRNKRELAKHGIKEDVKVLEIDVIKSLGFENKSNTFSSVNKSDEKRNNITGAYE